MAERALDRWARRAAEEAERGAEAEARVESARARYLAKKAFREAMEAKLAELEEAAEREEARCGELHARARAVARRTDALAGRAEALKRAERSRSPSLSPSSSSSSSTSSRSSRSSRSEGRRSRRRRQYSLDKYADAPAPRERPPPAPLRVAGAAPPPGVGPSPTNARVFHRFFVIGAGESNDQCLGSPVVGGARGRPLEWTSEPSVLYSFPPRPRGGRRGLGREACHFAFPSGVRVRKLELTASMSQFNEELHGRQGDLRRNARCWVFLLKDPDQAGRAGAAGSDHLYGLCVGSSHVTFMRDRDGATHQVVAPLCYCVVSAHPFFPALHSLVTGFMSRQRADRLHRGLAPFESAPAVRDAAACEDFMRAAFALAVPAPGASLRLAGPPAAGRPYSRPRAATPLEEVCRCVASWCCPVAWYRASGETLAQVVEALLLESKVVVVDANLAVLSSAALSLLPLLWPLAWVGPVIPVLPASLEDLLHAPVPCVVGVQALPEELRHPSDAAAAGCCVWFPSANVAWPAPSRCRMPGARALAEAAERHLARLRAPQPPYEAEGPSPDADAVVAAFNAHVGALLQAARHAAGAGTGADANGFAAEMARTQMMAEQRHAAIYPAEARRGRLPAAS